VQAVVLGARMWLAHHQQAVRVAAVMAAQQEQAITVQQVAQTRAVAAAAQTITE